MVAAKTEDKVEENVEEVKAPTQKTPQENADEVFAAKEDFLSQEGEVQETTPEDIEAGYEYVLPAHSQQTVRVASKRF